MNWSGSSLVLFQYRELPGLSYLQGVGSRVLMLALLFWLLVETYRLLLRGSADLVTPIVKVGVAILVVDHITGIGEALGSTAESIARAMAKTSELELFEKAFSLAVAQAYDQSAWETVATFSLFSMKTLMVLFACGLYLVMMVIKLLVIDVLWPICFGATLVLGVLAVPLGTLPGGSVKGWFRSLIEVALWPVVFQFMVAMMVSAFSGLLAQVAALDSMSIFSHGLSIGGAASEAEKMSQSVAVLVRFWALCVGYCLLGLGTPLVAGVVMRSAPVSTALAAGAFAASRLVGMASAAIRATGLGAKIASGAGRAGSSPEVGGGGDAGSAAPSAASPVNVVLGRQAKDAVRQATIDQRRYREPRGSDGGGR